MRSWKFVFFVRYTLFDALFFFVLFLIFCGITETNNNNKKEERIMSCE